MKPGPIMLLCPECQCYFQVPVGEDEDGYFLPPLPAHEPCSSPKPASDSDIGFSENPHK